MSRDRFVGTTPKIPNFFYKKRFTEGNIMSSLQFGSLFWGL